MEAATSERRLPGEKAQRIVEAMRSSVARRGVAGSTFDNVAREAGVSRGLLHYYFGTKERLLAEVVRHDTDVRMALLDQQLAGATRPDDVLERLVASLEDLVEDEPELITLVFELFGLSRRHEEIAAEFAELVRRTREQLAAILRAKEDEGAVRLGAEADAVADVLFAMADGMVLRMLAEPGRDWSATIAASVAAARPLLDAPA
ncbi:MAG TPA: TetR/AcrR family transcriptional regulator [Solirubrobacteraceae bacterium]|nr:TetR/AcrR family transcriptional regulator [Solirubrobacteraceae bacterium]